MINYKQGYDFGAKEITPVAVVFIKTGRVIEFVRMPMRLSK